MSEARAQVLGTIRTSLRRDGPTADRQAEIESRLANPPRGPVPARGQLPAAARLQLFVTMAREAACTVAHVADPAAVPAAVAEYLARENLPAKLRVAPDAGGRETCPGRRGRCWRLRADAATVATRSR